jgi:hypothetical protein
MRQSPRFGGISVEWLKEFWSWLGPIWGSLLAIAGGTASIDKGRKVIISLWKWCVNLYDKRILDILKGRDRFAQLMESTNMSTISPVGVTWIANAAKRRPKKVLKSLQRLERQGKIHEVIGYGWSFGTRKERLEIQKLHAEIKGREREESERALRGIEERMSKIEEEAQRGCPGRVVIVEEGYIQEMPDCDPELIREVLHRRKLHATR